MTEEERRHFEDEIIKMQNEIDEMLKDRKPRFGYRPKSPEPPDETTMH